MKACCDLAARINLHVGRRQAPRPKAMLVLSFPTSTVPLFSRSWSRMGLYRISYAVSRDVFFFFFSADLAIEARPFVLVRWGIWGLVRALSAFCRFQRGFVCCIRGIGGYSKAEFYFLSFPFGLRGRVPPLLASPILRLLKPECSLEETVLGYEMLRTFWLRYFLGFRTFRSGVGFRV